MENAEENQESSPDILAELEVELRRIELNRRIVEANIAIKQESGYFEAVSINAVIDRWRRENSDGYAASRRDKAEKAAAAEGRTLRAYRPATEERRKEQLRTSKQKQRQDPDFAAAEKAKNTAARAARRAAMTDEERAEANRRERERRAAKKPVL